MKNNYIPVPIILLATIMALLIQSFNATKGVAIDGYLMNTDIDNPICINTFIECSNVLSPYICQDGDGNTLYELDGTSCHHMLYKP